MTFKQALNTVSWALLFICICASSSCGDGRPKRVPVSGQVLIDGQPLKFGIVEFIPEDGRASMGALDSDGHFTLACFTKNDGALLGKHHIQVHAEEPINDTTTMVHAPKKYGFPKTSGLSEEIKEPTDSIVINLTWKGNKPDKPYKEIYTDPGDPHSKFKKTPPKK